MIEIDQIAVVDQFSSLQQAIARRAGPEVARLFAEPVVSRGNDQASARIDWYAPFDGSVRPLSDLDPGTLGLVRERLNSRLNALRVLAFDPAKGAEIAALLNVIGPGSVMAVGDEPIILDWGLAPADLKDVPPRQRHFNAVFGEYLKDFPLPPVSRAEWQERFAPPDGAAARPAQAPIAPDASASQPEAVRSEVPPWRAPAIAAALAAVVLLILSIPGVLRYPGDNLSAAERAERDALEAAIVAQLERRRQQLEAALGAPCGAAPVTGSFLVPPPPDRVDVGPPRATSLPGQGAGSPAAGASIPGSSAGTGTRPATPGTSPGTARGEAQSEPLPSPAAGSGAASVTTPEGQPTSSMDLAERISRGVALVVAGSSSGTGFFITPELVVTNRHVIENQPAIRIAGRSVGAVQATLVRQGSDGALGDFALLRVPAQRDVIPFTLSGQFQALGAVVAAGFPALHLGTDPVFRRLIEGDVSASRELTPVYLTGVVSHLQRYDAANTTLVLHSAEISPGNSGGPLVDYCGRVLGVNTFGRVHSRMPVTARYALGTDGLAAFLASAGVTVQQTTTPCSPRLSDSPPHSAAGAPEPARAPSVPTPSGQAGTGSPGPALRRP